MINDAQEVVDLGWAHRGSDPVDIPVGAFLYLDVASLDNLPDGTNLLWLGAPQLPNNLLFLTTGTGAFELSLTIGCDNAHPEKRAVKFKFDPGQPHLVFGYDR